MAVDAEGDFHVMEQLGEKQDFESELSRLGFRHEDFVLYVRRAQVTGRRAAWSLDYAVHVTNRYAGKSGIYCGGPRRNWVARASEDLARGAFGELGAAARPEPRSRPGTA